MTQFKADDFEKKTREELSAIEFDLRNNDYYNFHDMDKIKKEI